MLPSGRRSSGLFRTRLVLSRRVNRLVFLIGSASTVVGGVISCFMIPDMSRELETEDLGLWLTWRTMGMMLMFMGRLLWFVRG